ncbi:hypothetical protein JCM19236_3423 [Vibrio sp. JCM 19236]|nr:hypothetical protein JCM19236_3423 [Vibrio sp. JCM 19236]
MHMVYLNIEFDHFAFFHTRKHIDASIDFFANITLQNFKSIFGCPYYVVLASVKDMRA